MKHRKRRLDNAIEVTAAKPSSPEPLTKRGRKRRNNVGGIGSNRSEISSPVKLRVPPSSSGASKKKRLEAVDPPKRCRNQPSLSSPVSSPPTPTARSSVAGSNLVSKDDENEEVLDVFVNEDEFFDDDDTKRDTPALREEKLVKPHASPTKRRIKAASQPEDTKDSFSKATPVKALPKQLIHISPPPRQRMARIPKVGNFKKTPHTPPGPAIGGELIEEIDGFRPSTFSTPPRGANDSLDKSWATPGKSNSTPPLDFEDKFDILNQTRFSALTSAFSPSKTLTNRSLATLYPGDETDDDFDGDINSDCVVNGITPRPEISSENVDEADEEPMDWDAVDPGILAELKTCRQSVVASNNSGKISLPRVVNARASLVVVVDTNIWIGNMDKIEEMLSRPSIVVYVPWAVVLELDNLKQSQTLGSNARRANNLILRNLEEKNPRLCGQTAQQEAEAGRIFDATNADDRILQACLQLKARKGDYYVMLYTNDRNLAVKAELNSVANFNARKAAEMGMSTASSKSAKRPAVESKAHVVASKATAAPKAGVVSKAAEYVSKRLKKVGGGSKAAGSPQLALPTNWAGATTADVKKLMDDVWVYIFDYTSGFARFYNVGAVNIPEMTKFMPLTPVDCSKHLPHLSYLVNELLAALVKTMAIPVAELKVDNKDMLAFHRRLTSFLPEIDKTRPTNHEKPDDHVPIRPQLLLDLMVGASTREWFVRGLDMLTTLTMNINNILRAKKP